MHLRLHNTDNWNNTANILTDFIKEAEKDYIKNLYTTKHLQISRKVLTKTIYIPSNQ